MIPASLRRLFARAIVLLVAAGLTASACSSTVLAAATVNGYKIKRSDFQRELAALKANKDFYSQVTQSGDPATTDADDDTVSAPLAASWLSELITLRLIEEEFERRDLKVTDEARKTSTAQLPQQFGGDEIWKKFPKWFRDLHLARFQKVVAVERSLSKYPTDPEKAQEYFGEHRDEFDEFCSKHILVKTEQEADEIVAALRGGGDFAALAKERSTDTGSGAAGGELGCYSKDTFVRPFADALEKLELNTVSDPVESEFGFHVIVVTERRPMTWEANRQQILEALGKRNQAAAAAFLVKVVKDAEVDVDPRYGKVEKGEGQIRVTPPEPKPVPDRRQDTTTSQLGVDSETDGPTGVTTPTAG